MTTKGLRGIQNVDEVQDFILKLLENGEVPTLTIMSKCNRKFGTNDNQIRSLLIYMLRDGLVYVNENGEYGQSKVRQPTEVQTEETPPQPTQNGTSAIFLLYSTNDDDNEDDDLGGLLDLLTRLIL